MQVITLDFETYYSKDFSLSKITTEEYVRSPKFEVIGVSVKVDDAPAEWFSGTKDETKRFLDRYDWANSVVVAHNAMFDMAILSWVFDIRPKRIADTMSMAKALNGPDSGGSLAALVKQYKLGEKGDEVINALGMRRLDFDASALRRYAAYCKNDTELTYKLFGVLSPGFPVSELRLIDLTIRMFSEPVLELNEFMLKEHLFGVQKRKGELMLAVAANEEVLMSNPKFAAALVGMGVEPPMKISPTTGKETLALGKNDEDFKALLEHDDVRVQALVAARLGVKSTLEETRTERFIGIAERGTLPIPLRYYAAHTGRWGGSDKINMQNLPRKSPLKYAIQAPKGHLLIDSDSSQIEARTLAWLAGQHDLVEAFEKGEDVYKIMASKIYNKAEEDVTKDERFVGKTTILGCLAEGTLVLCERGWVPIENVELSDRVWDGEEWVCHQGLLKKGSKETLELCGLWLTPDHKVLCGTQWLDAQSVAQGKSTLFQALATGAANLPYLATYKAPEGVSPPLSCSATAGGLSTPLTIITSKVSKVRGVTYALRNHLHALGNFIGVTQPYYLTTGIESGSSIGYLRLLGGVTVNQTQLTSPTVGAVYRYVKTGVKTARRFLSTSRHLQVGITPLLRWIAPTTIEGTSRVTLDSSLAQTTCGTRAKSKFSRQSLMTYDIAFAGPRNRFTVATNAGPLIVHNCGYGMGAAKFRKQLKAFGVEVSEDEAQAIIDTYRKSYPAITKLWREAGDALKAITNNQTTPLGRNDVLLVEGEKGIRLPNGLYIKYPNLKTHSNEGKTEYVYDTKKGKTTVPNRIYGGKVVENLCQALARIIIGEQMLLIAKKYKVVMTVHDAIACIVPASDVNTAKENVEIFMRMRPSWAMDLPLNCEAGSGGTYGDC